jgi:hypothetical protein
MRNEETLKDWTGRIIGYIETKPNGDQVIKDAYRKILGFYNSSTNTTKDFYGRIIAKGNMLTMLLNK